MPRRFLPEHLIICLTTLADTGMVNLESGQSPPVATASSSISSKQTKYSLDISILFCCTCDYFCSLIYCLPHFPPIHLHLSPKKLISPAEPNPLSWSLYEKEVSICIRTEGLRCAVPSFSNSASMQSTQLKCAEKPKKPSQKSLSSNFKWKRAQRSGERPQDLEAEWDQIYWRKFSKIKFPK